MPLLLIHLLELFKLQRAELVALDGISTAYFADGKPKFEQEQGTTIMLACMEDAVLGLPSSSLLGG